MPRILTLAICRSSSIILKIKTILAPKLSWALKLNDLINICQKISYIYKTLKKTIWQISNAQKLCSRWDSIIKYQIYQDKSKLKVGNQVFRLFPRYIFNLKAIIQTQVPKKLEDQHVFYIFLLKYNHIKNK